MILDVEQYFLHPNYKTSRGLLADVALLKLATKVSSVILSYWDILVKKKRHADNTIQVIL